MKHQCYVLQSYSPSLSLAAKISRHFPSFYLEMMIKPLPSEPPFCHEIDMAANLEDMLMPTFPALNVQDFIDTSSLICSLRAIANQPPASLCLLHLYFLYFYLLVSQLSCLFLSTVLEI